MNPITLQQDSLHSQMRLPYGAAFGFDNASVTMQYGTFSNNTGTFTLVAPNALAMGDVMIGSCNHIVRTTNNPDVLAVGTEINCPTCNVQSNGSLSVACGADNEASTSSPGTDTSGTDDVTGSTGSGGSDTTGSTGGG